MMRSSSFGRPTMTVSCGRKAAFRTALWLLWMLVRYPRSSGVTFEVGGE